MKPNVMLAKPGEKGDCLRASLSSLLHVNIEHVPHFLDIGDGVDWWPEFTKWLADRGLYAIESPADLTTPPGYYLALGSTTYGRGHCVVAKGGEVAWDPRPHAASAPFNVESVIMLVLSDADKFAAWRQSCSSSS